MTSLISAILLFSVAAIASMLPPLVKTIPLDGVEGRIDHMAVDAQGLRLFIAAIGNNSVEVIDLDKGERVGSIRELSEPQAVIYNPNTNQIVVSNGGDGTCRFFDARADTLLSTVNVAPDADNMRLDAKANRIYVAGGNGVIRALNASNGTRIMGTDFSLPEHPEAFELEISGTRIFANLPDSGTVAVFDRARQETVAMWKLDGARENFPMALDEPDHRLFVACRNPARLLAINTDQGKIVASLPCVGDADDVWYDELRHRIYVSGGGGLVDIFQIRDVDTYEAAGQITTAPGARTSYYSEELHALYVAVPHRGNQRAELRVYDLLAK